MDEYEWGGGGQNAQIIYLDWKVFMKPSKKKNI